ncbi:MAG: putative CBL-interacting serine/threonine-protein kinase 19, partial [Streblomastix strix]
NGPRCRVAWPGLSIEGRCPKQKCEAFGKLVIHSAGYRDYNLLIDESRCPMCKEIIKPITPGFNKCIWRIIYKQKSGKIVKIPFNKCQNEYCSFNMTYSKPGEYERVVINVKESNPPKPKVEGQEQKQQQEEERVVVPAFIDCGLCSKPLDTRDKSISEQMKCGHFYHLACALAWILRGLDCPHCMNQKLDVQIQPYSPNQFKLKFAVQGQTQYHNGEPVTVIPCTNIITPNFRSPLLIIDPNFNVKWTKQDFQRLGRLGQGGFGTVRLMKEIQTGKLMAVKEMNYETEDEIEILGFFVDDDVKAFLIMEYCEGGNLHQYINDMKNKGKMISEQDAWTFISQMASAIFQMHSNGVIHGDLKPSNVLLTRDRKIKLGDFGLARKL